MEPALSRLGEILDPIAVAAIRRAQLGCIARQSMGQRGSQKEHAFSPLAALLDHPVAPPVASTQSGGTDTVTVHGRKMGEKSMEEDEQLLPGIPNEITIDQICPKLPWTAFHSLAWVNKSWEQAIRTHQVYDARVRSKSTQTLVALCAKLSDGFMTIALYSIEDGSCYYLPPIPGIWDDGILSMCSCVSLDGALFVLGGMINMGIYDEPSPEVFVLDLAGYKEWERCASMKDAREQFGCGVKDGKIYVFGGSCACEPVRGSEVYDSKADAWSPITPMPSFRYEYKVSTLGDEFFVHGGEVYDPDFFEWLNNRADNLDEVEEYLQLQSHIHDALSATIYNPLKDEWRIVEDFNLLSDAVVVMVGEKFYRLSRNTIEVYDMETGRWNDDQPIWFLDDDDRPLESFNIDPIAAVAVDGEILALVRWRTINEEDNETVSETCLILSDGVGGENRDVNFEKLQCDLSFGGEHFMCVIQL